MFWQYIAGLLARSVAASIGAWPSSSRYTSVLAASKVVFASSTISSFSGTRAAFFGWFAAASSSSSACEVVGMSLLARSGAMNGRRPETPSDA